VQLRSLLDAASTRHTTLAPVPEVTPSSVYCIEEQKRKLSHRRQNINKRTKKEAKEENVTGKEIKITCR